MNEFMDLLFQTCRNYQLLFLRTKKETDRSWWQAKLEQIEELDIMNDYEEWYIAEQERRTKEWNISKSLEGLQH